MMIKNIVWCAVVSVLASGICVQGQRLRNFGPYEGTTFLAVSYDAVWTLDFQAGTRARFSRFNVHERVANLSRGIIHSVALDGGKAWVLWNASMLDGSKATYISELTGNRNVRLEQWLGPFDFVFAGDGTFFVLGVHRDFPELIWRFDGDGNLLSSFFVDETIGMTVLSYESQLFVNGSRMHFVVPQQLRALELTLEGAVINSYEFDSGSELPRSTFQGPDGSVYVDLFFGTKITIQEGPDKGAIAFREPGVRIVRLDNGVLDEVLSIAPGSYQRQPPPATFRGLINGQFLQEFKGILTPSVGSVTSLRVAR